MTEEIKTQRVHVSDVSLTFFGRTELKVDVLTVKLARESFVSICPNCSEPHKLSQMYICSEDSAHGPYRESEIRKAKAVGTGQTAVLHALTDEEVEAVTTPLLDKNEATVSIFHAEDVDVHTRPAESAYRLRPHAKKDRPASKASRALYATILKVVESNPDKAFVFDLNLKGYQNTYRLEAWNGQLVAQKLLRPDDLAAVDVIDGETDDRFVETLSEWAADDVQTFVPSEWQNTVRENHLRIAAEKVALGEVAQIKPAKVKKNEDTFSIQDLMAQVAADREAVESKKTSKKKAA